MSIFYGSCTALITPFSKDGKNIDFGAFAKIIDYQIENGTNALVVLGTTGEPATMNQKEKERVLKFAISRVSKQIPVIAGAGSNCTETAILNSKKMQCMGADALLHVTPYYNKCTQAGIIAHFKQIAHSTNLPIIAYNVPGRTGVNILPETAQKLSEISGIVGIKEASGNIEQISLIKKYCGNTFDIYSGDDAIVVPVLSIGGKGVISVASNCVPKQMSLLCDMFFKNNIEKSAEIQLELLPLIKTLFSEVNPIPIKSAMNCLGLCNKTVRSPLTVAEPKTITDLQFHLKKLLNKSK